MQQQDAYTLGFLLLVQQRCSSAMHAYTVYGCSAEPWGMYTEAVAAAMGCIRRTPSCFVACRYEQQLCSRCTDLVVLQRN
jgi:hypothetical protein